MRRLQQSDDRAAVVIVRHLEQQEQLQQQDNKRRRTEEQQDTHAHGAASSSSSARNPKRSAELHDEQPSKVRKANPDDEGDVSMGELQHNNINVITLHYDTLKKIAY